MSLSQSRVPFPGTLTVIASSILVSLSGAETASAESSVANPVVVTATRTAETVNETLSTVRVLTREEILQRQARSLPDLLRGEAGIYITRNGGRGKTASLFMRGTESDHVLVLVDGIKVGSATSGTVPFQDIPLHQIERIEIVRGPRSSLYGSEAIGGVIQIFTRKGSGEPTPSLSLTAGSYDTYEASAGIAGSLAGLNYSASVSGADVGGFDACQAQAATEFAGCFADQPDDDSYQSLSGNLRLGYVFANGSDVSLSLLQSDSESEFDGTSQDRSENLQRVIGVQSTLVVTDSWWLKLNAGRSQDESDSYLQDEFASTFDTTRDTASVQSDLVVFDRDTLTLGADYQRDEIDTYGDQNFDGLITPADDFAERERENVGGFAQYQLELDRHNAEFSLRHDDNEQFGSQLTGGVGYGVRVVDGIRLVTTYGTAFKAPTFNELYYPGFGSEDLKPEESETFELGVRGEQPQTRWSVTYFQTEVDELIGLDENFQPVNIDEAEIRGIEFVYDRQVGEFWLVGLDATFQRPINRSQGANRDNRLARRPDESGRLDIDYIRERWSAGISLFVAGQTFDNAANTRQLDAYHVVDLKGEITLAEAWKLQARLENLLDEDYQTAAFYNQPGTSFYLTLRYAPE